MRVPFNRPARLGNEGRYLDQVLDGYNWSAGGSFARKCEEALETILGGGRAIVTHTCTDALEAAIRLVGAGQGDEVILPSFTFVATATAVALSGAVPVFVDIDPETLDLDPDAVEAAITPRTKAIILVHYAGVGRHAHEIAAIADRHGLTLIEDAAHALGCTVEGDALARVGALATLSFHETKNLTSGEGGALIVNDSRLVERAEIVTDKGTDRARFQRGEVQKYVWQDLGSSYRMSELSAAVLLAQLEKYEQVSERRSGLWSTYQQAFEDLERQGRIRRPSVPQSCRINGHIYYLLLPTPQERDRLLDALVADQVIATFHYVPLHSSPAGMRYGRVSGTLDTTDSIASRLIRLPIFHDLADDEQAYVIERTLAALG